MEWIYVTVNELFACMLVSARFLVVVFFSAVLVLEKICMYPVNPRRPQSWGYGFHRCLYVCFLHDVSKTSAARTTKLDVEMFCRELWILIYFGIKVIKHKNIAALAWVFALFRLLASSGCLCC